MGSLFKIILSILDKFPSRKEALLNEIDNIKSEIYKLQNKETAWTLVDSANYNDLTNRLSALEKRRTNAGV